MKRLFSSEQVSKYHPDKYADQISDSVVALAVSINANARCAIETMVKDEIVILGGELYGVELSTEQIYNAVNEIAQSLNYNIKEFYNFIGQQSNEIHNAVDTKELGAGDQGMVYGYATRETDTYLPLGFDLANKIIKILEDDVPNGILKGDAKCQVTVDLDTKEIHTILISACHNGTLEKLKLLCTWCGESPRRIQKRTSN